MNKTDNNLSIIVVGASGDLARKKIFPALFALYCQDYLPKNFNVFGFSRTEFSHEDFRAKITEHLTCRYVPGESCAGKMSEFLAHCHYSAGAYGSRESFLDLYELMRGKESSSAVNRMFYLAIPPSIFLDVAHSIAGAGLVNCGIKEPWSRVVIEKPFGKDRESSDVLTEEMAKVFSENQTYRIDHYLGKEVVQNLFVLRFANQVFEPIWNSNYIEKVCIDWRENIGVESRAGYFDEYGIIRDVVQNHLLQVLAMVAMERPKNTSAQCVRDEKVKALRCIKLLALGDVFLGQYAAGELNGKSHVGYLEEKNMPPDSITPTYAAAVLRINNSRWKDVPFVITAGKGLNTRLSEVKIHFKQMPNDIFDDTSDQIPDNQLVIRIQPDASINLKVINKKPGLDFVLTESNLDLIYKSAFESEMPDAYECLLLDVIEGDKSLFIRSDELEAAWDIFTPVLHEIEKKSVKPELYPFGSDRPGMPMGND
ncbi:glucose-6-phosphate dehydrogenase [Verrucomicrobiota bacterium]